MENYCFDLKPSLIYTAYDYTEFSTSCYDYTEFSTSCYDYTEFSTSCYDYTELCVIILLVEKITPPVKLSHQLK